VTIGRAALFGSLVAVIGGCGSTGHAPTARIVVTPPYLPLGDAYHTDAALDGSGSRDEIDDPAGARPLSFAWTIDDPMAQVTAGALDAAKVTVRVAADHPTQVTLAVTDGDGDTGTGEGRIGVSVPP
jgi:hypothetical protein